MVSANGRKNGETLDDGEVQRDDQLLWHIGAVEQPCGKVGGFGAIKQAALSLANCSHESQHTFVFFCLKILK